MADRQLVLAVFPDEPAADNAAGALKDSGIAHGDAIGILALDGKGKLKQDKVGARSTGKGAAIGGVLFLAGPAILGVGVLGGTAAGALHHKNLGLSDLQSQTPRNHSPRVGGSSPSSGMRSACKSGGCALLLRKGHADHVACRARNEGHAPLGTTSERQ